MAQSHGCQSHQCLPRVESRLSAHETGWRRQDHQYRQYDLLFWSELRLPYATSKGGIVQLSKSLALAWAADNIQVNAILPGWFETELTDGARAQVPGLYERVLARIPAGRWARPEEVAGTAIWLA